MGDARAAAALLSRTPSGGSERRACSILKREYRLSRATGDDARYLKAVLSAAKRLPSPALRALAAAALVEAGRGGEARALVPPPSDGERTEATGKIAAAAYLDGVPGMDRASAIAMPAAFWEELAKQSGRPGFRVDAALSALSSGDRKKAAKSLRAALASGADLPAQLAYDCGLYPECLRLIDASLRKGVSGGKGGAELALLEADARYLNGERDRARACWRRNGETIPESAPVSLHNLAATERDPGERERLLSSGLGLYPADTWLPLDMAELFAASGRRAEGEALLDRLEGGSGDGKAVGLSEEDSGVLRARLELASIGAESLQTEALLLKAVWARPRDAELARYAFLKLMGIKRYEAAFRLLLEKERDGSEADWLPFGAACLLAAKGDGPGAVAAFDACGAKAVHYASAWNSAALLARQGDWKGARARLAVAIASAGGPTEAARAYSFMGDCLRSQGSLAEAKAAYLRALGLWSECPEAGLALANASNVGNEKER